MTDTEPELVTLRREELFQFLGRYALPPWLDVDGTVLGGRIDCAAVAEELVAWVREHELVPRSAPEVAEADGRVTAVQRDGTRVEFNAPTADSLRPPVASRIGGDGRVLFTSFHGDGRPVNEDAVQVIVYPTGASEMVDVDYNDGNPVHTPTTLSVWIKDLPILAAVLDAAHRHIQER